MEGYHGTVFAYGMTGTGKTFSMQGTSASPGVIPLAITDIFSFIRETPHREFLLRVSYLEIYNEKIHDLLCDQTQQQEEIKLREDSKRGIYATPLKEEIVQSPTQLLRVIARGDQARRVAGTQFNARSSRSHAVVQIVVESRERVPVGTPPGPRPGGGVRVSTLSLIDLAGSERAADSKERRTEGAHINKSLLTLGNVIARLSENKDKNGNPKDTKHLPYRDSKLTRLLQPALSGTSLISILCTVQLVYAAGAAPGGGNNTPLLETINTLKFASRAKNNIASHAKRAEETAGDAGDGSSRVLLERYRVEISSLKTQMDAQAKTFEEKEGQFQEQLEAAQREEAGTRHGEQVLEMQLARTALKERIDHLNRLILSSKSTGVNITSATVGKKNHNNSNNTISDHNSTRSSLSITPTPTRARSRTPSVQTLSSEVDDPLDEFADGMAGLQVRLEALQADLEDKNRYISILEKRLLQARRSSHSRLSLGLGMGTLSHKKTFSAGSTGSNGSATASEGSSGMSNEMLEKDIEISSLKSQLDDKDRMVNALRSASRQRDAAQHPDLLEFAKRRVSSSGSNNNNNNSNNTHNHNSNSNNNTNHPPFVAPMTPSMSPVLSPVQTMRERASLEICKEELEESSSSSASSSSSSSAAAAAAAAPVPPRHGLREGNANGTGGGGGGNAGRRSIGEVSRLLDTIIQERIGVGAGAPLPGGAGANAVATLRRKSGHQQQYQQQQQLQQLHPPPQPPQPHHHHHHQQPQQQQPQDLSTAVRSLSLPLEG